MKQKIIIAALSLLSLQATAQTEVTAYKPGITTEGITYFLPQTRVRVKVTARKTHYEAGEYCEYAERYLRLKDVPQTAYDEWEIEDIQLTPYGVADPTRAYSIKMRSKTSAPLVSLMGDGRLVSVNAPANLIEPVLPQAGIKAEKHATAKGVNYKTEEILAAGSTAKMAELAANEIYDIRENRNLLTKGQADFMPKDGEQLRLMLASLDTQEAALLQLFQGTATTQTETFVFDIIPTEETASKTLFSFSRYLGVVDADDPAGTPVRYAVKDLHTLPAAVPVSEKEKQRREAEDLRYIVPGKVQVTVFDDSRQFASETLPMAQFGRIEHLGGDLFNRKSATRVQLSPVTGGIVKIEAEKPE